MDGVPMNSQFCYNYISEKIELLALQIIDNGRLNLLNLNIHAETFYRELLNMLYDYRLKGVNTITANTEAIDLYDEHNKLTIQVTSQCTVSKINATLKKKALKSLAEKGYRIKFVFIAHDANKLRAKEYNNLHKISFAPKEDILDKHTILSAIRDSKIEVLIAIYELMLKEFEPLINQQKISSNLSEIINLLSKEDLTDTSEGLATDLRSFDIDEKISFNDLGLIKETTIDEYKNYLGKLERLYNQFDQFGTNKKLSVFRRLTSFYEVELINSETSAVQKFFNVIDKTYRYVRSSSNLDSIPDEELRMCIKIVVVDAFIRCKIFKKPSEDKDNCQKKGAL